MGWALPGDSMATASIAKDKTDIKATSLYKGPSTESILCAWHHAEDGIYGSQLDSHVNPAKVGRIAPTTYPLKCAAFHNCIQHI